MRPKPIAETTEDDWDAILGVNAKAAYFLCQAFGPLLADGGSIVLLSSVSARSAASQEQSVYCASKAAVSSIARSFAYAYAPRGIRVNAVLPGIVDTPMQERFLEAASRARGTTPEALHEARLKLVPLGRTSPAARVRRDDPLAARPRVRIPHRPADRRRRRPDDVLMSPRRALVTGSARGIGRAVAEALAAEGLEVVGVDVALADDGACARTIRADLGDAAECSRVVAEAGDVDVLVNNAAVLFRTPLEEFTVEEFDRTVAVNLRAAFLLSQALGPAMAGRGWGRIVNVSSIGARDGRLSHGAAYAATKAGVLALTRSFARAYGGAGVTVNAVAPGAVDTEMTASIPPATRAAYLADIPAGRFCSPAEVASAVAFLAGDGASFVNGATLDVNGGWFAPSTQIRKTRSAFSEKSARCSSSEKSPMICSYAPSTSP